MSHANLLRSETGALESDLHAAWKREILEAPYLMKAAVPHRRPEALDHQGRLRKCRQSQSTFAGFCDDKGELYRLPGADACRAGHPSQLSAALRPVWTPLIPSTRPPDKGQRFGEQVPMKRPAQAKEIAPVFVLRACDDGSYISGATVAVTDGKPTI